MCHACHSRRTARSGARGGARPLSTARRAGYVRSMHRTAPVRRAPLLVPITALALAAPTVALAAVEVVRLNFDVGTIGQPVPAIPNLGAEPDIAVAVVSKNSGQIVVTSGRTGNGRAIDLPDHDGASTGQRAVVMVVDSDHSDGDALSPGLQTFTFGADFKLDATSTSTQYDDGNNLIQRGLAGSSHQYKIQVDNTTAGPRPSCALAQKLSETETLSAMVTSTVVIVPGAWHRVRCTRQDTTLKIVVTPYNADGTPQAAVTTSKTNIPAIDLTWPLTAPVAPMSIGGKLNPAGTISSQSDQFNGAVDNAVLIVG